MLDRFPNNFTRKRFNTLVLIYDQYKPFIETLHRRIIRPLNETWCYSHTTSGSVRNFVGLTVQERRLEQRPRRGDFGGQLETEREHSEQILKLLKQVRFDTLGLVKRDVVGTSGGFGSDLFRGVGGVRGRVPATRIEKSVLQQTL